MAQFENIHTSERNGKQVANFCRPNEPKFSYPYFVLFSPWGLYLHVLLNIIFLLILKLIGDSIKVNHYFTYVFLTV
jgi:hypothetical protein